MGKSSSIPEVIGLVSHLIPAQALSRIERGRKRQGLVPDFRLSLSNPAGGHDLRLAELKVMACSQSRYPASAGGNVRGTDRRAQGLEAEYRRKAREVDKDITDISPGPVERKLDEYGQIIGLAFGAWGEASYDVHQLIQTLAESRLSHIGMQRGRPGSENELGQIVAQIRRRLSVTSIKAQVECLLSRIHQVGENKQLSKKREWVLKEENRMAMERGAQWIRSIEGIQSLRKGHIKTA